MNLSRRELLAAGAASAASAIPALPDAEQGTQSKRAVPPAAQTLPASNLPIRDYLAREARLITDNALASQKDGKGPALEMLSCLRYTDLSQIAGLLHPAQIVVSGEFPSSYAWAEELYGRLGSADKFRRVKTLSDWA